MLGKNNRAVLILGSSLFGYNGYYWVAWVVWVVWVIGRE